MTVLPNLIRRHSSARQLAEMRMESNHARGFFAQLQLAVQRGLTFRLHELDHRVKALKSMLQVRRAIPP
jgi:hypothetical protein